MALKNPKMQDLKNYKINGSGIQEQKSIIVVSPCFYFLNFIMWLYNILHVVGFD